MCMRLVGSFSLGVMCLALLASRSHARTEPCWPYETLFKESTLIVVVKPWSVRDATAKDKAVPPAERDDMVGIVTTFRVVYVVKGEYKNESLDIVHFRMNKKEEGGPCPLDVQNG